MLLFIVGRARDGLCGEVDGVIIYNNRTLPEMLSTSSIICADVISLASVCRRRRSFAVRADGNHVKSSWL